MADERKKGPYHINPQLSRTYFSYRKPSDTGYAMMHIGYFNNMLKLHFRKMITSENIVDLDCFLPDAKAYDISRLIEGVMARRRDAYIDGKNYDADEVIRCPTSSYREGKEVPTGMLVIDTEMFDGIPRLRITYNSTEKQDSVEIVFNARVPSGQIESKCKTNGIDYADIMAYDFVNTFKELQNPLVPIIYRIQDAAVSSITKYISACFGNRNNNSGGNTDYRTASSQSYPDDGGFDPY